MKLLAIETSSEACSAALYLDGELQQELELAPRRHGELIIPMVDKLLASAQLQLKQLDGIAFGRGPGSFIGVRIAAGVTQGLAYGADLPVIPVSSLAAIAQNEQALKVFVAVDARMDEVYWAQYSRASTGEPVSPVGDERISPPNQVSAASVDDSWSGAGSAWSVYQDALMQQTGIQIISENAKPSAAAVAQIAVSAVKRQETVSPAAAQPVYIRDKVAKKPGE